MNFNNKDVKSTLFILSSLSGIAMFTYWAIHNSRKRKNSLVKEKQNMLINEHENASDVPLHTLLCENNLQISKIEESVSPKERKLPNLKIEIPIPEPKNVHNKSISRDKSLSKDQMTVEDTRDIEENMQEGKGEEYNYNSPFNSSSEFSDSWDFSSLNEGDEDEGLRTQFISPLLKEESSKGTKFIWKFLKRNTDPIFSELQTQFEKSLERNFSLGESSHGHSLPDNIDEDFEFNHWRNKKTRVGLKNTQIRKLFINKVTKSRSPPIAIHKTESMKSYLKGKCPDIKLKRKKQGRFVR